MSFANTITWVHKGFLCFGGRPGRQSPLHNDLSDLRTLKVRGILSLVEVEDNLTIYREQGFSAKHVPVPDLYAPEPEQFEECIRYLESIYSTNAAAYVHCLAGYGRSATIAAAWLIYRGAAAEEAVRMVRTLKAGTIESEAQYNALLEYAGRLQMRAKTDS